MHLELPPIAHLGYVVSNIKQAVEVFVKEYSLDEKPLIYDFKPDKAKTDGADIDGCHLKIALFNAQENIKIELIEPISGETEHKRFLEMTGGGIHHVAYRVKNYKKYRQYILDKGAVPVFEQEIEDPTRGYRRCCYFRMLYGCGMIEILEAARFMKRQ